MSQAPDLPALRVLVVDDDEDNRRLLCRFLPSPPLEIETAADERAALDTVTAKRPDVILLDLEMPVMDGFEAAARVRALERATGRARSTIIGLSAHHDDAVRRRSLDAGCDAYLTKPVSRATLVQTLRDAVHAATPAPAAEEGVDDARPGDPVAIDPGLESLVAEFLGSRGPVLDELESVLASDERGRLRRLAHRLAGSFGLYGFRWAASQCHRVEQDAEHAERAELAGMLLALRTHLATVEVQYDKGESLDGVTRAAARRGRRS